MKIKRIVVGIDFSSYAEQARRRALEMAAAQSAKVYLVHAFEDSDYQGQQSWLLRDRNFDELLKRSRDLAREQLEKLAKEEPPGVEVRIELSDMEPYEAIVDAAKRHKADLVVIGTHGRTGFERLKLARNTERIVRNSTCSVLVARASKADLSAPRRILVPTDFSESAEYALSIASSMIVGAGRIDVLHCWLTYFYATGYHGLYEETLSIEPEMAKSIRKQGEQLLKEHPIAQGEYHFEEKYSAPVSGIQEALEHTHYDLVVMGSRGRHGVTRLLLGSTAEATARHANCSVLIARSAQ